LCKIFEWVKGPLIIHSFKDCIENSFTAASGSKCTHGSDPPADLHKEPFDYVGGADTLPVLFGTLEEGEEFLDILGQASDGFGGAGLPALLPLPETFQSFLAVLSLVDEFGFFQTRALRSFEFVFQVTQLVRPAALVG